MKTRRLIRNATIVSVDPGIGTLPRGDILIEGKRIAAVGVDLVADDAEVVDGTGRIALPNCYGAVKAARLDSLAEELGGIDIVTAYSDHISDLDILRRAARGVAVNPSPALRRAALAEGLEIADWGRATRLSTSSRIPETAS